MNNQNINHPSNSSYDERFYTPRAQAASSRSTSSFETPRSSLYTGRSRESSSNDSYYTPRNIIESGRSINSSHSENINIHPHFNLHSDFRRLPPQRPGYQIPPQQRFPTHRPSLPPNRNLSGRQYLYQGDDIESSFSSISMNQNSESNQKKISENIFSLARHSKLEEVDRLLIEGMDVNAGDENGNTILCIASQNGNKRMAKLALKWGCDINVQNMKGNTPLHFCYQYGYRSLGEYLISKGADSTIRNMQGLTCFELGDM